MTILAIGATGFIGPPLVRHLHRDGHDVAVFHRGQTEADLPGAVLHVHGDRNELRTSAGEIAALDPDVVIDVVPYTEAQAQAVVDVCAGVADRIVALSSSDVYRNYDGWRAESDHSPAPTPLSEDAPLRETRYPYRGIDDLDFAYAEDYDKILVEDVVMNASEASGTILRLPAVYGPGDAQHRFRAHVRRMDDDRPAILLAQRQAPWRWTHGYVENVAAAIARAATDDRAAGRVYNVGELDTPTAAERIRQIGAVAGWEGDVVALPPAELPDPLRAPFRWQYDLATDTRRLREELGFHAPVSREDALQKTIAWEREHLDDDSSQIQELYAAEDEALQQLP